ncbi:hypothetical protein BUALT_Bualt08G0022800 [Buddleja alternifolia]|uniref:Retrotransposon gag domain-containing protein n=1 Tax=Buddleja alternifolia TaxID=168488 RepID=A0AAV6X4F9_9LAMI|nr:hypothetical protein BUALT_Bualt08G0022800 [Buddleja alternifolia]
MERSISCNPVPTRTRTERFGSETGFSPFPKMEFPRFDGDNPMSWVRHCNRYFQIISSISEEHKVPLAAMHLEGRAELWYQGSMEGKDLPIWIEFTAAELVRFDEVDPYLMVWGV